MVMLCLVCAWHALVSALPADQRKYWDNVALVAAVLLYIAFHGVFVLWMYLFVSLCVYKWSQKSFNKLTFC